VPLFGVHVIKLTQSGSDDDAPKALPGLKVIAVIKNSPASNVGLVRGDSLLKLGDVTLNSADDLFAAVKRYAGQKVSVAFQRGDVSMGQLVELNVRK
jgi:S1-C subfamily serine protease